MEESFGEQSSRNSSHLEELPRFFLYEVAQSFDLSGKALLFFGNLIIMQPNLYVYGWHRYVGRIEGADVASAEILGNKSDITRPSTAPKILSKHLSDLKVLGRGNSGCKNAITSQPHYQPYLQKFSESNLASKEIGASFNLNTRGEGYRHGSSSFRLPGGHVMNATSADYTATQASISINAMPNELIQAFAIELTSAKDVRSFALSCKAAYNALTPIHEATKVTLKALKNLNLKDTVLALKDLAGTDQAIIFPSLFNRFYDQIASELFLKLPVEIKFRSKTTEISSFRRYIRAVVDVTKSLPVTVKLKLFSALRERTALLTPHAFLATDMVNLFSDLRRQIRHAPAENHAELELEIGKQQALAEEAYNFLCDFAFVRRGRIEKCEIIDIDAAVDLIKKLSPPLKLQAAEFMCHVVLDDSPDAYTFFKNGMKIIKQLRPVLDKRDDKFFKNLSSSCWRTWIMMRNRRLYTSIRDC